MPDDGVADLGVDANIGDWAAATRMKAIFLIICFFRIIVLHF